MNVHVHPVFPSKISFMEAVRAGKAVALHPADHAVSESVPESGQFAVSGPGHGDPATWRATMTLKDGLITKVR